MTSKPLLGWNVYTYHVKWIGTEHLNPCHVIQVKMTSSLLKTCHYTKLTPKYTWLMSTLVKQFIKMGNKQLYLEVNQIGNDQMPL